MNFFLGKPFLFKSHGNILTNVSAFPVFSFSKSRPSWSAHGGAPTHRGVSILRGAHLSKKKKEKERKKGKRGKKRGKKKRRRKNIFFCVVLTRCLGRPSRIDKLSTADEVIRQCPRFPAPRQLTQPEKFFEARLGSLRVRRDEVSALQIHGARNSAGLIGAALTVELFSRACRRTFNTPCFAVEAA